jgi:hypothetical protein
MLRSGEPFAVHHRDQLTEAGMKRVVDDHLTRQTPGIVTPSRPGSARVGSPVLSATGPAGIIAPSSNIRYLGYSML